MSELDELGGLEKVKQAVSISHNQHPGGVFCFVCRERALIEHIESLTAERDALKKRVEELESKLVATKHSWKVCEDSFTGAEGKLQAARELAGLIESWERQASPGGVSSYEAMKVLEAKARDFLKMMEEK